MVVGIASAADQRSIAYTSWGLVQGATGGGGAGQVAMHIQRNRAHRIVPELRARRRGRGFGLRFLEPLHLAFDHQVFIAA